MQHVPLLLLALTPLLVHDAPSSTKSLDDEMHLNWKTPIGSASFKTNVLLKGQDLYLGSNGDYFHDYYPMDSKGGVYRINARTGKIMNRAGQGDFGDMDVNGVLILKDKLYFGNDNEEFICTSLDGKIQWSLATSGDIEHEPVLIRCKSTDQLVYATEMGEVRAVEPETGKTIWEYFLPDFKGWKPEKNRLAFKVGAYFSSTESFYTKPELADLNNDGTLDLVYQLFRRELVALDGATGKLLWSKKIDDPDVYISSVGSANKPLFVTTNIDYSEYPIYKGTLNFIDKKGEVINSIKKPIKNKIHTINSLKINQKETLISLSDSLYVIDTDGNIKKTIDYGALSSEMDSGKANQYYSDFVMGTNVFSYKGYKNCMIMMRQYDYDPYVAYIDILSIDEEKIIDRFRLKERSEMPPVVSDVNKDGKLDLLVNSFDGYLYCYTLPSK